MKYTYQIIQRLVELFLLTLHPQEPIRYLHMPYVSRLNRVTVFKKTWLKTYFKSETHNGLIFIKIIIIAYITVFKVMHNSPLNIILLIWTQNFTPQRAIPAWTDPIWFFTDIVKYKSRVFKVLWVSGEGDPSGHSDPK